MNLALRTDAIITAIAIAFVTVITFTKGEVLFIGYWYYVSVFLGVFILSVLVKPKPLFITGAIIAAGLAFGVYIRANWTHSATNDLLALGHLFSLPGAAIGLLVTAITSRLSKSYRPVRALAAGFLGFTVGFVANQAILCSTVMYCGSLLGMV